MTNPAPRQLSSRERVVGTVGLALQLIGLAVQISGHFWGSVVLFCGTLLVFYLVMRASRRVRSPN